ncbi:unnamed protein product [Lepeophtheirus salmonis]|uniref:(salmon louse) hypothetical protein n=1 Tax=Lepeophtheirus salmonis TaxID=72036 RepID=A0A7R8D2P0_LEPSM|nr:unnamed protein product [Lepeophtheirus salmonis]CAF2977990.1 unnamed protein product [Lepeophtheirus salmonis]
MPGRVVILPLHYLDKRPYEVIEIINARKIKIQVNNTIKSVAKDRIFKKDKKPVMEEEHMKHKRPLKTDDQDECKTSRTQSEKRKSYDPPKNLKPTKDIRVEGKKHTPEHTPIQRTKEMHADGNNEI